ncbi:DUF2310 family Zn-ribbon-containing protein [Algicola sagamiensis]|uniref:DUF2310 family Zn-ribbon-containing protein n=1 Tax=Algicola sagamiensis TaxID=163869 RepID=UPI000373CC9F|nr:DUF2310 family Zn-ribbon-containing protein [Algicola sagamiensis]
MPLYQINFGEVSKEKQEEAEDKINVYLCTLTRNGQARDDYHVVVSGNQMMAYIHMNGRDAIQRQYHSKYGLSELGQVVDIIGQEPTWSEVGGENKDITTAYSDASHLFLFTHLGDASWGLFHGDSGFGIPLYCLPVSEYFKERFYFWVRNYQRLDALFMNGYLEIQCYKELASPESMLSKEGRSLCAELSKALNIPVYYYLLRYWGRREGEAVRLCPGCGETWQQSQRNENDELFHHFHFKCDHCFLVSHIASAYDDERHARIGEWREKKTENRK